MSQLVNGLNIDDLTDAELSDLGLLDEDAEEKAHQYLASADETGTADYQGYTDLHGIQIDAMNALGFAMLALNHDDEGEALENIARARTHLSSAEADYIAAADELTDADGAVIDSLIGAAWASVAAAERTLPVE